MYTIAQGVVVGSRHARMGRNGQDAASTVIGERTAVAVVADGCGSGASSEVGARLGARLFAQVVSRRLGRGEAVTDRSTWEAARIEVGAALAELLERMGGDREVAMRDHMLFTLVACAMTPAGAAIWALGDGAFAIDRAETTIGPFADNAPPYLAYDLLGDDPSDATFVDASEATALVIATDGSEGLVLADYASPAIVAHPDGIRRRLAVLARGSERIDWDAHRVVRTPATIQDDCAIAVIRRAS